jgi:hypothetical protein
MGNVVVALPRFGLVFARGRRVARRLEAFSHLDRASARRVAWELVGHVRMMDDQQEGMFAGKHLEDAVSCLVEFVCGNRQDDQSLQTVAERFRHHTALGLAAAQSKEPEAHQSPEFIEASDAYRRAWVEWASEIE